MPLMLHGWAYAQLGQCLGVCVGLCVCVCVDLGVTIDMYWWYVTQFPDTVGICL